MKIAFASDLHFEFQESRIHSFIEQVALDTDVLILAGDIQIFERIISDLQYISSMLPGIHIVYVTGNHEFYGENISVVETSLNVAFQNHPRVHYLEKHTFHLNGVTFLGTTLWTGFDAYPYYKLSLSEENATRGISDFKEIFHGTGKFQTHHCKKRFKQNCEWLSSALKQSNTEGKATIVVTHFPPSPEASHGSIPINSLSNYFQADCRDIINQHQPDYWIYGHNHWSDKKLQGKTQIMSNQLGYPNEYCRADDMLSYITIDAVLL